MITTIDAALTQVKELQWPQVFQDILNGNTPSHLKGIAERPKAYFEIIEYLPARISDCSTWLPLWETNLGEIKAYDLIGKRYIRYFYGDETFDTLGASYQQFIAAFFLELIDGGIWGELGELSEWFKFQHLDQLREFVRTCPDTEYVKGCQNFIARLV